MSESATSVATPPVAGLPTLAARPSYLRVFAALIRRDAVVTRGELGTLIAQGVMQPFLLLFVFGRVITSMGFANAQYAQVLYPGMIVMVTMAAALQSSSAPLIIDFATGREIEDRLLAPVPTALIAVEKIVFAALRALFTAVLMVPIGLIVLGRIPFTAAGIPVAIVAVVIGSLLGASIGMVLGTTLPPNRISMMFSLVLMPLLFTGAAQYPWAMLDHVRWFQVVSVLNPMTYFSESMRAALAPDVPHMNPWLSMTLLIVSTVGVGALAIRGFRRRAVH
ncbi:MAG: ABC transporter permease [Actinocatenispora sp.]